MPASDNSPTGVSGPPEFVRARLNTIGYDKWMHTACYLEALKDAKRGSIAGKGIWRQLLMNAYFNGKICMGCHVPLQCSCSAFKVTEPNSNGKCSHAKTTEG